MDGSAYSVFVSLPAGECAYRSELHVADLLHGGDDVIQLWQSQLLQIGRIRHRDVLATDPDDRRVKMIERLFHHAR